MIELVITLCLIVLIMGIGLPSLTGQSHMRRLQAAFDRFDAFVVKAQQQSARDGKPYVLSWTSKGAIRLLAAETFDDDGKKIGTVATFLPESGGEHFTLVRGASLVPEPDSRWTFWPTGNCEPVRVRYESPTGTWVVAYNPLSGRGTINEMIAR